MTTTHIGAAAGSEYEWWAPLPLLGSAASGKPALARHDGTMYLAYKEWDGTRIWLASSRGHARAWTVQGVLPGRDTGSGPALVSLGGRLYVVYALVPGGQIECGPVDIRPQPHHLAVMTVNVRVPDLADRHHWWSERLPRIDAMLHCYEDGRGPHIVGMNEVEKHRYDDIQERLSGYDSVWYERGGLLDHDEGQAIFYRRGDITLLESGNFVCTRDERRERGGCTESDTEGKKTNRNIVWGRFRETRSGRTFYVFNAHWGGSTCELRGNGRLLGDLILAREHPADPVIAMGDFNLGEDAETHRLDPAVTELLDRTGLTNAFRMANAPREREQIGTGNDDFGNRRDGDMIDFVLASAPPFQVCDANIDRTMFTDEGVAVASSTSTSHATALRMYSDHWAVWAELAWWPE